LIHCEPYLVPTNLHLNRVEQISVLTQLRSIATPLPPRLDVMSVERLPTFTQLRLNLQFV